MIGCDIVAISRVERIYARYGRNFLDKFLNQNEQKLIKNPATIAGFFAAKEAASKALGVGICEECGFLDIIIKKDSKNAPKLEFSPKIHQHFAIKNAALSIAHDGGFAMAVVMLDLSKF